MHARSIYASGAGEDAAVQASYAVLRAHLASTIAVKGVHNLIVSGHADEKGACSRSAERAHATAEGRCDGARIDGAAAGVAVEGARERRCDDLPRNAVDTTTGNRDTSTNGTSARRRAVGAG